MTAYLDLKAVTANMATYRICDEASQNHEDVTAESADAALSAFLSDHYQTIMPHDDGWMNAPAGFRYSKLEVFRQDANGEWSDFIPSAKVYVYADGKGGVLRVE